MLSSLKIFFKRSENHQLTITTNENDVSPIHLDVDGRSTNDRLNNLEEQMKFEMSSIRAAIKQLSDEMTTMRTAIAEM